MQTKLAQALKLQQQGQLHEAEELYKILLDQDANNAEIWHYYAIFAIQQQSYEQALVRIHKAIQLEPNKSEYQQTLANILKKLNQPEAALAAFEQALKLSANLPEVLNQAAILYYQQHNFLRATTYYKKAIALKPDYAEAHFNLALLLIREGKREEAKQQLQQVLQIYPQNVTANKLIADLFLQQKLPRDAIKHYTNVLAVEPEFTDALNNLGAAYMLLQQAQTAIQYFTKVLFIDDKHLDARNNLAAAYLQAERYVNAYEHYRHLVQNDPDNLEAQYNLGVCCMAIGELAQAQEIFSKVLSKDPQHTDAAVNLAGVYLKLKNTKAAEQQYQQILSYDVKHVIANYMLHALRQDSTPNTAPYDYVKNLFDNYAGYYEKHIHEELGYQVPNLMRQQIMSLTNKPEAPWRLLDLGCGSGLIGAIFQDQASYILGIDISEKMLNSAKLKNCYSELTLGDIQSYLKNLDDNFDLIIAADTFVYIGDLANIFQQVRRLLNKAGLFCFSVEALDNDIKVDYQLQKTARFAHSKDYLIKLAEQSGFTIVFLEKIILRYQEQEPVYGWLGAVSNSTMLVGNP